MEIIKALSNAVRQTLQLNITFWYLIWNPVDLVTQPFIRLSSTQAAYSEMRGLFETKQQQKKK